MIQEARALDGLVELTRGKPVAVLSGAGLSTASGIPAYRDAAGQWRHATPIRHQEFLASAAVRQRYWARSFVGWPRMADARPNRGHLALAALEARGVVSAVVTQNVDGLHAAAGSGAVIELHGNLHAVRCLTCAARFSRRQVQDWLARDNPEFLDHHARESRSAPDGDAQLAPEAYAGFAVPACPACAGVLKPEVVFFGDNVPRERAEAAAQAVDAAQALLVVGSSLMVYSGFRLVERAHRQGKPVIAINRGVTRADALLSLKIEADCGAALAAWAAAEGVSAG